MIGQERDHKNVAIRLWEHELPGGWLVQAGKTDADNDRLSIKLAKPDDWWFHVRGMPGSHVLLKAKVGEKPSREILKQAAAVAAYYSKARFGGITSVTGTLAKNVTKPKGAKPGTVTIRKETVFKVRPAIPPEENS